MLVHLAEAVDEHLLFGGVHDGKGAPRKVMVAKKNEKPIADWVCRIAKKSNERKQKCCV
jgi:hypothetical protein